MAPYLKRGSRGAEVVSLQEDLNLVREMPQPALEEDGIFGRLTDARVREFQYVSGIKVDGIVGPVTRGKLTEALSRRLMEGSQPPPQPKNPGKTPGATPKPTTKTPGQPVSKAEFKELIRQHSKNPSAYLGSNTRFNIEKAYGYFSKGYNIPKFLGAIGALDKVVIAGYAAAPAVAVIGAVIGVGGTLLAWNRALESSETVYGFRGFAYAVAAWTFNKPVLDRSKEIRGRILQFKFEDDMAPYDKAWKQASQDGVAKMRDTKVAGLNSSELKAALQLYYGGDIGDCCREMLTGFNDVIQSRYPKQLAHWKTNLNVVYPR